MRIPEHIIDQVRTQSDIVDVIGEHVKLKRSNRNYLGLCPFHKEKTPSFNVNTERGIFKCFGCGKAGNVITFVEEYMHMGFVDAVRHLAARAGIEIPEERREDPTGELARKDAALRALREAADHYRAVLASSDGAPARAFYTRRGFSDEISEAFKLGAAPAAWDVTMNHLLARGFAIEHLVDAGLVITREDGKTYDRFRGRAMFAISDEAGRVVGFSARTLTDEPGVPKYVNSPQSIVFDKSRVLFGLDRAKRSITEHGAAILVEGQADVISMHQAGFTNTVASSGTSLTPEQLRLIKRYADTIILVFDSDEAGQKAMTRGVELGLAGGLDVKCVVLPPGTDPDSLLRGGGLDEMRTLLDGAVSWLTFQTDRFRAGGLLDDPVHQAKAVRTMLTWIASVPDALRHPFLVRDLADRFRLDERYLASELGRITRNPASPQRRDDDRAKSSAAPEPTEATPRIVAALLPPERELMRMALTVADGLPLLLNRYHVTEETFWSASGQRIFRRILIAEEEHGDVTQHILNDEDLTSDERREIADILFTTPAPSDRWQRFNVDVPIYDAERPIRDALLTIEIHRVHERIDQLTRLIESTVDLDEKKRHIFRLTSLIRRREELRKRFDDDPSDLTWLNADSAS
jgi:DNA primase